MGLRASFGSPAPAVPGEMARCDLSVENTGERADDVRLSLSGELAAWGWITPPTLSLAPGETGSARLTVKLPRGPHPPAGPLAITISLSASTGPLDVHGALEVAPFADLFATLDPHTSRGRRGRHELRVENRGNADITTVADGTGDDVSIRVDPVRLSLPPGGSATATVTARPGRQRFRGATTERPFEVVVRPDGPGRPGRAEGMVEVAPAGWVGRVALVLLVLAIAGVAVGALFGGRGADDPAGTEAATSAAPDPACPARDHLSPDANGIIRPGIRPAFDYTFLFVTASGCQPVRFNPCEPIRYALNRGQATDAHVADLMEGLRKLSTATGLQFERVADSNEDPRMPPRVRRQPDGTLAWPPVLIGWARLGGGESLRNPADTRPAPDTVVGGGGRPFVEKEVIVSGNLILNLDAVTDIDTRTPVPHGFGTGVNWGRIILHELAHVIGLGHVESRTSIMNEALTQQTLSSSAWGVGDLIGLRLLGREGGCVTVPPVPPQGAPR